MPLRRLVPDLTDLVYLPVSELIKNEALEVASNCITKFQLDDDDDIPDEITDDSNQNKEMGGICSALEVKENGNASRPLLTLEEHIKRRYVWSYCAILL